MTALTTPRALTKALSEISMSLPAGEWTARGIADALIASGAVVDVATLADEISAMFPYNGELRPDGSEDPLAAAYVEGLHDAWQVVQNRAAALTERAS